MTDNLDGSYSQTFTMVGQGLAQLNVQVLGVSLPTVQVDTALPVPISVDPASGRNDVKQMITVRVAANDGGDAARTFPTRSARLPDTSMACWERRPMPKVSAIWPN